MPSVPIVKRLSGHGHPVNKNFSRQRKNFADLSYRADLQWSERGRKPGNQTSFRPHAAPDVLPTSTDNIRHSEPAFQHEKPKVSFPRIWLISGCLSARVPQLRLGSMVGHVPLSIYGPRRQCQKNRHKLKLSKFMRSKALYLHTNCVRDEKSISSLEDGANLSGSRFLWKPHYVTQEVRSK